MNEISTGDLLAVSLSAIVLGMIVLVKAGGWVVEAAIYISRRFDVSPMVVGFTVVAFGTSLPELMVSVNANLKGDSGIAIGNVVGSNIANILLILGASAALHPLLADPRACMRDLAMMVLATIAFVAAMMTGQIERWHGGLMVAALAAYVTYQYMQARRGGDETAALEVEEAAQKFKTLRMALGFLLLGLIGLGLGADILVRGTEHTARVIGVPDSVVALTLVAFGTSLPELATCIAAIRRRQTDIIVGNVIGSNVFNILSIIGIAALIKPIVITPDVLGLSMWVMAGTAALLTAWLLAIRQVSKPAGIAMVVLYIGFVVNEYFQ